LGRAICDAGDEQLSVIEASAASGGLVHPLDALAADAPQPTTVQPAALSRDSARGLDWFTFFLADVQTGFGPFVAVYLAGEGWTQGSIGLLLTVGGLAALAGQMPGGALIDATRSYRLFAALALAAIAASALAVALWPIFPIVMVSRALHAAASCVLGPAIAAISFDLVGHAAMGERLGRNARFASSGNCLTAAALGVCGLLWSSQAVFFFTAALVLPCLIALMRIRMGDGGRAHARRATSEGACAGLRAGIVSLAGNRSLLIFAACAVLFHFANAAMLPLMGAIVGTRSPAWATTLIAACTVVPQLVVAGCSPFVGRQAQRIGRRPLLLVCFAALALRALLFALVSDSVLLVAVQALDGVSAAVLGVTFPLIVVDLTHDTGRFNLALGIMGTAVGIGASLSTTAAGVIADHFGSGAAFISFAAVACAGLLLVWTLMPETRPGQPG
jgi:MFS family permease